MPKATSGRIAEAQRQRQQISKKSEKYGPSTVYLQVLGSGARGAPNTLYLFTDQKRYLFNCGECTQRLAHEHKVKLSRLDHIFITTKTWKNIGGLPGLSLTLQDVGVPNITLHGPEGLDELYAATRRFVIMKDMQVTMAKCRPSEDFEDNVMNVKYVLLGPNDNILAGKELKQAVKKPKLDSNTDKEYEEFIHDDTDYYKNDMRNQEPGSNSSKGKQQKEMAKEKSKPKPVVEKDPLKKKTEKVLHELQKKTHCSVAYICTLKKRLGTLDLAKCVERGVKPGPMLGQLKSGHDVVLPDGSLVLSKDVKTPDDPGPVFIVLEVPDLSYLKEAEFAAHFDNDLNPPENIPTLMVHFTPPHVFHHPTYRAFMALFGPCTRHLVLNSQNSCLGSEAVHRTQHKLHLLDPDIFPLLRDVSVPAVWNSHPPVPKTNSPVRLKGLEELKNKIALAQFQNIINLEGSAKGDGHQPTMDDCDSVTKLEMLAGRTLTTYHLRPKRQLDRAAEPKLHIQDYIQETMDVDGFVGSLEQFRRLVDSMRYARCDAKEYPKVVFLGTGSCIPSKTRNTSAIVLHIDENHSMLLDCGEGTFGQLVRFYGPKKVNAFLRTLKAIYISHLHADHHIGLIGVIQARRQALQELGTAPAAAMQPLYLLAPGQIVTWLTLYDHQFERLKNDYTLIPNQNLIHDHPQNLDLTSAVLSAIGVESIRTCLVAHCPNAFGVAVNVDEIHKITYSGDTLPCDELVKIGTNSTLLIHEATMEDELADEARTKMHSTTTQAIDIGRMMNARYTVLTHFSQRYARLPRLNAHILNDNNSVGIAFDNMQITMSDLELLPHMYAPLQLMFAEHCVEMELKAVQRSRRASSPALAPGTHTPKRSRNHSNASSTDDAPKRSRNHGDASTVDDDAPKRSGNHGNENNSGCHTESSLPDGTHGGQSGSHARRTAACRAATSAPQPHARYRESNASRLRQEIKGMTVTGTLRRPRSRSNSASTSGSPASRRTPLSCSRQASKERPTSKGKQEQVIGDKDKHLELPLTPRSVSENFSRDTLPSGKTSSVSSSGHVLDSRSKTLSSVGPMSADEVLDIMSNSSKKNIRNTGHPKSAESTAGYGKPLVTPVNKRLTLRRDLPWQQQNVDGAEQYTAGIKSYTKSPTRPWKAENRESSTRSTPHRPELMRNKILKLHKLDVVTSVLGHLIFWRVARITAYMYPGWGGGNLIVTVIVFAVLFWTATKASVSGNKLRASNTNPNVYPDTKIPIMRSNIGARSLRPSVSSLHRSSSKSPARKQKSFNSNQDLMSATASKTKQPQCDPKDIKQWTREPMKKATSIKDVNPSVDKMKATNRESLSVSPPTRPTPPGHSNRSFRPQLEDIKSSYLLLNKQAQDIHIKTCTNAVKTGIGLHSYSFARVTDY
uniref:Zinc phosphodiesterase ELAC protein 2 n=1 Tax=Heliothis virescens TaxID=7102 RepID=A0A2A4JIJ4_HELVI